LTTEQILKKQQAVALNNAATNRKQTAEKKALVAYLYTSHATLESAEAYFADSPTKLTSAGLTELREIYKRFVTKREHETETYKAQKAKDDAQKKLTVAMAELSHMTDDILLMEIKKRPELVHMICEIGIEGLQEEHKEAA